MKATTPIERLTCRYAPIARTYAKNYVQKPCIINSMVPENAAATSSSSVSPAGVINNSHGETKSASNKKIFPRTISFQKNHVQKMNKFNANTNIVFGSSPLHQDIVRHFSTYTEKNNMHGRRSALKNENSSKIISNNHGETKTFTKKVMPRTLSFQRNHIQKVNKFNVITFLDNNTSQISKGIRTFSTSAASATENNQNTPSSSSTAAPAKKPAKKVKKKAEIDSHVSKEATNDTWKNFVAESLILKSTGEHVEINGGARGEIDTSSFPEFLPFPKGAFHRVDNRDDSKFYKDPKMEHHIDDACQVRLGNFYREILPENYETHLDLCTSWYSHFPKKSEKLVGLGMNMDELKANEALDHSFVEDLNFAPSCLQANADLAAALGNNGEKCADIVTMDLSIDYLIRPVDVMESILKSLKNESSFVCCSFSNRMFPTKVADVWRGNCVQRQKIVASYMHYAGFEKIELVDLPPAEEGGDPLSIIIGYGKA